MKKSHLLHRHHFGPRGWADWRSIRIVETPFIGGGVLSDKFLTATENQEGTLPEITVRLLKDHSLCLDAGMVDIFYPW
jgi:hypothetical protein